ncbi:hypothetical protein H7S74_30335 [Priestia aryabhattai]|uniref:hypothetical protein n=1 Tax=Priestia aryabhattai TaxID=412384 RepID=UPI001EBAD87F|nr:hypothetical protein [Priestia aryabhattai]MBY0094918.1 hypothetical protein [Priestia aryabhattai]MBY0105594.1 hypothetical protein [Priestia aryabhattai]
MTNLFNVIVEVKNAEFTINVKADSMEKAWEQATTKCNNFTTRFDTDITFMTQEGKMNFRHCEESIDIEEVFHEGDNEYTAVGNFELVVMRDVKANSYSEAVEYAYTTFNDGYMALGNMTVTNGDNKSLELSIANYEIEVGSIEETFDEIVENNQKSVAK